MISQRFEQTQTGLLLERPFEEFGHFWSEARYSLACPRKRQVVTGDENFLPTNSLLFA